MRSVCDVSKASMNEAKRAAAAAARDEWKGEQRQTYSLHTDRISDARPSLVPPLSERHFRRVSRLPTPRPNRLPIKLVKRTGH